MVFVDRGAEDCFVFLASPVAGGSYGLMIYPEIPEIASQVEVSKGRMRIFLARHRLEIAVEEISETGALFVSAMTKDDVRELAEGAGGIRRCATRLNTRQ